MWKVEPAHKFYEMYILELSRGLDQIANTYLSNDQAVFCYQESNTQPHFEVPGTHLCPYVL